MRILMMIVMCLFLGCSPLSITANSLKAGHGVVRTMDQATSDWYLEQHALCLREGTSIRDKSKLEKKAERSAEGFKYYTECMEHPTQVATKISSLVHDIKMIDKDAAEHLLDIARGNKSNKDLKYPSFDIIMKVGELKEIVKKEGI